MKKAVEWDRMPCIIRLLPIPKPSSGFYDFDEYERLVTAAKADRTAYLIVLLGGEAGLRCGEMMALEWTDVDLAKRQLCVQRSDWARDAAPAAAVSHFGQLERAQKSVGASVVGPSSPPEFTFRADEQFVAQSDRVLVPGGYARADPARHVYQRADAATSDQRAVRHYNQQPKPFVWTKEADTILAKIDRCKEAPNAPDEENVKLGVPWCVEPP